MLMFQIEYIYISIMTPPGEPWEVSWRVYDERAVLPHRQYAGSAGWDLLVMFPISIPPLQTVSIPVGLGIGKCQVVCTKIKKITAFSFHVRR